METMGYWDSGNQLRDPYNHRPVCILSKKVAAKILNPKKDRDVENSLEISFFQ